MSKSKLLLVILVVATITEAASAVLPAGFVVPLIMQRVASAVVSTPRQDLDIAPVNAVLHLGDAYEGDE